MEGLLDVTVLQAEPCRGTLPCSAGAIYRDHAHSDDKLSRRTEQPGFETSSC